MSIKQKVNSLKKSKIERTKAITFITMVYNFLWSIVKIVFGCISTSYLFCVSGCYTLLIGFNKKTFFKHYGTTDELLKYKKSIKIGILTIVIGCLFTGYMSTLFFLPRTYIYSPLISIAIAAFSFTELGVAISNMIKSHIKNDCLLSALRGCNLVSSFFAIVLTQVAILSAYPTVNANLYNGITGVVFGVFSIIVGVLVCNKRF